MQQNEAVLTGSNMNLDATLRQGSIDLGAVANYLDGLESEARIAAVRTLSGKAQAQLFEAAKGAKKLTLEDIVPKSVPNLQEVPHYGKNSLLMFTHFAKVFCRPEGKQDELWGYNRSGGFVETFVGPGYYVAYVQDGEVMVDYTRLPEGKVESWPTMLPNTARFGRFVYAGMIDALRGVSKHVTIGRAIRNGKVADNWFVLCRSV